MYVVCFEQQHCFTIGAIRISSMINRTIVPKLYDSLRIVYDTYVLYYKKRDKKTFYVTHFLQKIKSKFGHKSLSVQYFSIEFIKNGIKLSHIIINVCVNKVNSLQ